MLLSRNTATLSKAHRALTRRSLAAQRCISQSAVGAQSSEQGQSTATPAPSAPTSSTPPPRQFKQEGGNPHRDFAAELRKTLYGSRQQSSKHRRSDGDTQAATANRQPSRPRARSPNAGRKGQGKQTQGGSRQGGKPGERRPGSARFAAGARSGARTPTRPQLPRVPVQTTIEPTTDWAIAGRTSEPFARVPYAAPRLDLDALNDSFKFDIKTHKPLKTATAALHLNPTSQGAFVQGPLRKPTPIARPGWSEGAKAAPVDEAAKGDKTTLRAQQAHQRVQTLREVSGGDYQRWQPDGFLKDARQASPFEHDAAHAVAHNDDLQPAHKAFTVNAVRQIVARLTR